MHAQYVSVFFFFNDTATTEIYTLSLHDALPIWPWESSVPLQALGGSRNAREANARQAAALDFGSSSFGNVLGVTVDRKSTRLNSSHSQNLVCRLLLEKKKKKQCVTTPNQALRHS